MLIVTTVTIHEPGQHGCFNRDKSPYGHIKLRSADRPTVSHLTVRQPEKREAVGMLAWSTKSKAVGR